MPRAGPSMFTWLSASGARYMATAETRMKIAPVRARMPAMIAGTQPISENSWTSVSAARRVRVEVLVTMVSATSCHG